MSVSCVTHLLPSDFTRAKLLDHCESEPRVEETGEHVRCQEVQRLLRLCFDLQMSIDGKE